MNAVRKLSGTALAAAAAGLLLAGCANGGAMNKSGSMDHGTAMEGKVHCAGVNSCKGQTACKTATNNCKGENSCKGKGFLSMTKADCAAKGGSVI